MAAMKSLIPVPYRNLLITNILITGEPFTIVCEEYWGKFGRMSTNVGEYGERLQSTIGQ